MGFSSGAEGGLTKALRTVTGDRTAKLIYWSRTGGVMAEETVAALRRINDPVVLCTLKTRDRAREGIGAGSRLCFRRRGSSLPNLSSRWEWIGVDGSLPSHAYFRFYVFSPRARTMHTRTNCTLQKSELEDNSHLLPSTPILTTVFIASAPATSVDGPCWCDRPAACVRRRCG